MHLSILESVLNSEATMHSQVRHGQYNSKAKSDAEAILTAAGRQQAQVLGALCGGLCFARASHTVLMMHAACSLYAAVTAHVCVQRKRLQRRISRAG